MTRKKKFSAFLSFAEPDRPLVEALQGLFQEFDLNIYYAPKDLPRSGSPKWRKEILSGLRGSRCYIPVYTKNSLNRPWVLYESGVADCLGLVRYPTRVSGVPHKCLFMLPSPDDFVFDLFDTEHLLQLIVNMFPNNSERDRTSIEKLVKVRLKDSTYFSRVIQFAKSRSIFIAGNAPNGRFMAPVLDVAYDSQEYSDRLTNFIQSLTVGLMDEGFNISSCPTVDSVGSIVFRAAGEWIHNHSASQERFSIGGLYPLDHFSRESTLSQSSKSQMKKILDEYRKQYLKNQESLIIVGGNQGTAQEYKVARKLKLQVLAIPCFGGTAYNIWSKEKPELRGPCNCFGFVKDCNVESIAKYLHNG